MSFTAKRLLNFALIEPDVLCTIAILRPIATAAAATVVDMRCMQWIQPTDIVYFIYCFTHFSMERIPEKLYEKKKQKKTHTLVAVSLKWKERQQRKRTRDAKSG